MESLVFFFGLKLSPMDDKLSGHLYDGKHHWAAFDQVMGQKLLVFTNMQLEISPRLPVVKEGMVNERRS